MLSIERFEHHRASIAGAVGAKYGRASALTDDFDMVVAGNRERT